MANLKQIQTIGSGPGYPVKLTTKLDSQGKPTGEITYGLLVGEVELIKQNLTSLLLHQIGQMIRNEYFGTRVQETLEEPNTQASEFLIRKYLGDAISSWEPRITNLRITSRSNFDTIELQIQFQVNQNQSVEELNFSYNPNNNSYNVY